VLSHKAKIKLVSEFLKQQPPWGTAHLEEITFAQLVDNIDVLHGS